MINVMNHFQDHNRTAKLVEANRRKWFIAAREDKERKAQLEDEAEQALVELAAAVIVATELQIQTFHAKLDTYDEATVAALMENQELLDAVNERIADMLSRAHKLEDGRRVFKTEDGKNVYDEHGEQIDETVIHPDMIDNSRPKWEAYNESREIERQLEAERKGLIDYQDKLDDARERSSVKGFTEDELNELETELEADMPLTVAKHVPGMNFAEGIELKSETKTPATSVNSAPKAVVDSLPAPSL